jgi:two-component system chemotaxis response regulator CheY
MCVKIKFLQALLKEYQVKIFIVDDSQLNRKLVINALQKVGVKNAFLQASDGKKALDVLAAEHKNICLVFLDWQLPKVDGLEILKQIARNPDTASLPVIMLTSTGSPESKEIAQLLNPNLKNFLVKPLDPEEIVKFALPLIK